MQIFLHVRRCSACFRGFRGKKGKWAHFRISLEVQLQAAKLFRTLSAPSTYPKNPSETVKTLQLDYFQTAALWSRVFGCFVFFSSPSLVKSKVAALIFSFNPAWEKSLKDSVSWSTFQPSENPARGDAEANDTQLLLQKRKKEEEEEKRRRRAIGGASALIFIYLCWRMSGMFHRTYQNTHVTSPGFLSAASGSSPYRLCPAGKWTGFKPQNLRQLRQSSYDQV